MPTPPLDSARTAALGLANRVVPDAVLRDETMALARRPDAGPRVAWRHMEPSMRAAVEGTLSDVGR